MFCSARESMCEIEPRMSAANLRYEVNFIPHTSHRSERKWNEPQDPGPPAISPSPRERAAHAEDGLRPCHRDKWRVRSHDRSPFSGA
jgi:hypothetical protein